MGWPGFPNCGSPGVTRRKFLENIGTNWCEVVHLGIKVCILNNSLFNLDFGRSYADIRSSKVGRKIDAFYPTFKSGTESTVPAV